MASSLSLISTLFLTLLYFSQANDLINKICSQATNPSLCNQALGSDPRASRADLAGLGQIALEKSAAADRDVVSIVKSSGGGGAADVCVETCGRSINDLNKCSDLLRSCGGASCKGDLQTRGSAASANVVTCEDAFGRGGPARLMGATKRARELINVFLVIANSF
ncbi:pectinesterase inhibitor-like [Salvia hispanica]|uniref:pectinesterase inhibitor-like n=1 Tax=Salvia hispanica TaxID=49212 RepID=UPI002008F19B|nr:pectinesterase inhibitor-like [Salvia hispanica]